jgi:hypothetical protein
VRSPVDRQVERFGLRAGRLSSGGQTHTRGTKTRRAQPTFELGERLVQRLIELRKENWSAAMFPVENYGFEEETSWADEYKRILKLFEEHLKTNDARRSS